MFESIEVKVDSLYKEYLNQKLDLIFKGNTGISIKPLFSETYNNRPQDDYEKVTRKGRRGAIYNFVNQNDREKFISQQWYPYVDLFYNGCARVKNEQDLVNFIDKNGTLIGKRWYIRATNFNDGLARVYVKAKTRLDRKQNFINVNGEELFKKFYDEQDNTFEYNGSFAWVESFSEVVESAPIKTDLKDYTMHRSLFSYILRNNKGTIKIKYLPVKVYGRHILCISKDQVYLYDSFTDSYILIGSVKNVNYNDYFIFNGTSYYLVYENQFAEITDYYLENLSSLSSINISNGVTFASREEFSYRKASTIDEMIDDEKREHKELREKEEKEVKESAIKTGLSKAESSEAVLIDEAKNARSQIEANFNALHEIEKKQNKIERVNINQEDLFIKVDDHFEIKSELISKLRFINLTHISFTNVKMDGLDFSNCNLNLNPQEAYNKNLRNANFTGVYIGPWVRFSDVDIRGASFSIDNDPISIDYFNETFKDAIYDSTTTWNGIPIEEFIKSKIK